jgi:RND family efflux transporter MFP subunit
MTIHTLLALGLFAISQTAIAALTLQPLSSVLIYPQHTYAAQVVSPNDTTISAQLNARIEKIAVRPGETIKAEQLLVSLDCQDSLSQVELLTANRTQTQASLSYAQAQVERLRSLKTKDYASVSQLELAQSEAKGLAASLSAFSVQIELAKRTVERCQIRAPYAGVVREQLAGVGALATVGMPLLNITQTSNAEIQSNLPFNLLPALQTSKLIFNTATIGDIQISLLRQSKAIDATTRNVSVWFKTEVPLAIGLTGTLTLTDPTAHVPAQLLVKRNNQLGIFIREDGKARFMPLPLAQEGRPTPVPAHWQAKMAVISDGHQRLNDGEILP